MSEGAPPQHVYYDLYSAELVTHLPHLPHRYSDIELDTRNTSKAAQGIKAVRAHVR